MGTKTTHRPLSDDADRAKITVVGNGIGIVFNQTVCERDPIAPGRELWIEPDPDLSALESDDVIALIPIR